MPLSAERKIYIPPDNDILSVTPHPLLEQDLSFRGVDTQYSTHSIHPYVAAINQPLVSELIKYFVPTDGSILDPYCGGGGVLVEGIINNRPVSGNDINPLAVSISKAKTTYLSQAITEKYFQVLLDLYSGMQVSQEEINELPQTIKYWFKEYMLEPLLKIKKSISCLEDQIKDDIQASAIINLYQVIFSATIRDVMLTYRGEVRLRKLQGQDLQKFSPHILEALKKRSVLTFERVNSLPVGAKADVILADTKMMPYKDNEFSTIICSPPYGDDKNGVGYFQFSSKMLYFLGYEDLKKYKKKFLGGDKEHKIIPPSASLSKSLKNVYERNQVHFREAVAFYNDYYLALQEMKRVTTDRIIIVVGNRVLSRTFFDNAKITVEMLEYLGVKLDYYFQRELPKKRIANLGGDGGGGNLEHILVFKH